MRLFLHLSIKGLWLLSCISFAADNTSSGRLVTGCVDRSIQPEFCNSVVRYRAKDAPALPQVTLTAEQKAVHLSLGEYSPVQPAQIQGSRASVLVQRGSGEFLAAFLEKVDGQWSMVSVAKPSTAKP
jgi:hypothetical protein